MVSSPAEQLELADVEPVDVARVEAEVVGQQRQIAQPFGLEVLADYADGAPAE
ncbi:hypothetical protein [Nonomuraea ceibae]|uniref:hypothetical protein n=1 Tax=Nonomuraea ceibae TaxID=1935170 RepID=UPI001C603798|nr:hypothetical protein [Nonomuraea ceibae]